jgi:hypothetical protein
MRRLLDRRLGGFKLQGVCMMLWIMTCILVWTLRSCIIRIGLVDIIRTWTRGLIGALKIGWVL